MSHRAKGAKGLGKSRKDTDGEKKQRKPRQKRDLSPDSRAEERAKREAKLGRPIAQSPAEAAWNGLENNKKGNAQYAYLSIMKDAKALHYPMTKTEAAKTAKKHPEPSEAVGRARAHHNVKVSRVKKQKKE